jgi:hypothetical protein
MLKRLFNMLRAVWRVLDRVFEGMAQTQTTQWDARVQYYNRLRKEGYGQFSASYWAAKVFPLPGEERHSA